MNWTVLKQNIINISSININYYSDIKDLLLIIEALRVLHDTQKGKDFKAKYNEYLGKKDPLLLQAQKFLESLYLLI